MIKSANAEKTGYTQETTSANATFATIAKSWFAEAQKRHADRGRRLLLSVRQTNVVDPETSALSIFVGSARSSKPVCQIVLRAGNEDKKRIRWDGQVTQGQT